MDDALYRLHAEREETYWWWVAKNRIIMSLVDRYAPKTPGRAGRALDIGCGAGGVLSRLAERYDAIGVDMSPLARAYCAARGLRAVDGSLPDGLPFAPPEAFDVIVMSEVVEHVEQDRASVQAAAALLKPGGVLICTVPAHRWLWSTHDDFNRHVRRYSRRQFGTLFEGLPLTVRVLSYAQMLAMPLVVGARVAEMGRRAVTGRVPAEPSVRPLWGPLNGVLRAGFEIEKHVLPFCRVPIGTSVISVHERTG